MPRWLFNSICVALIFACWAGGYLIIDYSDHCIFSAICQMALFVIAAGLSLFLNISE